MSHLHLKEGFLPFRGYRTFYRLVGDLDSGKIPLLAIHGRPVSHEALEPLEKLSETGRPVIFYDQLGCGKSDRPDDPSMWNLSLFVDEVSAVLHHFGLTQVHLLGHSWGGAIALEHVLKSPAGINSLILASTFCDRALFDSDFERLRANLPGDLYQALLTHEADGTTDDPAYKQAEHFFDLQHVCRVDPIPDNLIRALEHQPVGRVNLDGWTVQAQLRELDLPTLITCGRYDFCTPAHAKLIHNGIRGSQLVIFEQSSHYPHIEETGAYLSLIDRFMTSVEQKLYNV